MVRNNRQQSRREFLKTTTLIGAPALTCALTGGGAFTAERNAAAKPYQVLSDWPKPGFPQVACRGIDADSDGQFYVSGDADQPILMIRADGKYMGHWGKGLLTGPHGVRVHRGTVWVTDTATHMAHQFTRQGKLIRSFGVKGVAGDAPEQFNRPTDFAFGPDGTIYISDGYVNTRVVCRNPDGSIRKIWGEPGDGPSQFKLVHAIAIDAAGRVYVGDRENQRVQVFDLEGNYIEQWRDVGKPYGLYACQDGSIFLCGLEPESGEFRVLKLTAQGKLLESFGGTGDKPGQFLMAHSLHVSESGDIVVADGKANRVQKFTRS